MRVLRFKRFLQAIIPSKKNNAEIFVAKEI